MADQRISINPPTSGTISLNAGDALTISTPADCTFACSAGNSFSPSLNNAQLSAGDNGPYVAEQPASNVSYSARALDAGRPGQVSSLNAKSIQINP
ncbi:MAG TPA: hypothetical protein VGT04_08535 [Acidobacteriaceae bacterium]|nr:hypothetical protein [Acidobacteriaceae bacterium]